MTVHYKEEAERDLEAIARYSLNMWGRAHRDAYIAALETVCEQVLPAHYKRLARPYARRPGVLMYRADAHVVYFREVDDGLEILAVRHVRRAVW